MNKKIRTNNIIVVRFALLWIAALTLLAFTACGQHDFWDEIFGESSSSEEAIGSSEDDGSSSGGETKYEPTGSSSSSSSMRSSSSTPSSSSIAIRSSSSATPNGSEFELRVLELTNIERAGYGLPPLIWHDGLASVARAHSKDMMLNNITGHTGSDGSSPSERVARARDNGVIPNNMSYRAENAAYGQRSPETVVEAWMNSEGHRANILNGSATHLGVGFVPRAEGSNAKYVTYWTQVFGQLR